MKNKLLMMAGLVALAGATITTNILFLKSNKKTEIDEENAEENTVVENAEENAEENTTVEEMDENEQETIIDDSDINIEE